MFNKEQNNFIPVKEAAELVGYTTDYVARLAREKKIDGRRAGHQWLVERDSIKLFQLTKEDEKKKRQQELRAKRLQEKEDFEKKCAEIEFDPRPFELQALATTVVLFAAMIITTGLSYSLIITHPSKSEIVTALVATASDFREAFVLNREDLSSFDFGSSGVVNSASVLSSVSGDGQSIFSDLVCGFKLLLDRNDDCLNIPPVINIAARSIDRKEEGPQSATSTPNLTYASPVTQVVNNYITNPIREVIKETIVKQTVENAVSETRFEVQADRTYDSLDGLQRALGEGVDTGQLTVSGNATLSTTTVSRLTASEALFAGSYVSAPYFTATDANATSTFAGALTVGTTTSYAPLTLNGAAYLASTTAPVTTTNRLYNQGGLLFWDGTAFAGASVGTWQTDGTSVWRNSGNVGLGTSTPTALLHIIGTTEQLRLAFDASNYWSDTVATNGGRTLAGFGTDADLNFDFAGATDGDFSVNGDDLFVDTSSGFVGIGSTSPSATLSVSGTTHFAGNSTTTGSVYISGGLGIGVATTSSGTLQTSGNAYIGGDLTVVGNSFTFGSSTVSTMIVNSRVASDLIPQVNAVYDLGSPALFWDNAYIDTLTVNNISAASSTISGTQEQTFTINSDNATTDAESSSLLFYRGTVVPNALITWDSVADKFDINQPWFIQNDSATTTIVTLDVQGTNNQTANIFRVSSSTGSNYFSVTAGGNVGIGTSSPLARFSVSGNTYLDGNLTTIGTTTLATTTGSTLTLSGAFSALSANITNTITAALASVTDLLVSGTATTTDLVATNSATLATTTADNLTISGAATLSSLTGGLLYASGSGSLSASTTLSASFIEDAYVLNTGDTITGDLIVTGTSTLATTTISSLTVMGTSTFSAINPGFTQGSIVFQGFGGLTENNANFFWDNTTNRLGIGTSTPVDALEVVGGGIVLQNGEDLFWRNSSNATTSVLELSGDTTFLRGGGGTPTLRIDNSTGTNLMTFLENGNVGIGTTTPIACTGCTAKALHIEGSNAGIRLFDTDGINGDWLTYTNGGEYRIADNNAGSATRLAIDSSGNVGIGTTSPLAKLYVLGGTGEDGSLSIDTTDSDNATSDSVLYFREAGTAVQAVYTDGSLANNPLIFYDYASGSDVMAINNGNVGIGTANPDTVLHVTGANVSGRGILYVDGTDAGFGVFNSPSAGTAGTAFAKDGTVEWVNGMPASNDAYHISEGGAVGANSRLVILAGGNVGIGTTTPIQELQVFGDVRVGTSGSNGCIEDYGGGVIGGTCSSDERLKTNINALTSVDGSYMERIAALTPVTYNWNGIAAELYSKNSNVLNTGLIAQDVEVQFPELISYDAEGYRQVDFRSMTFYIMQAFKELYNTVLAFAERFISDEIVANNLLCVGETCVNEADLKAMLSEASRTGQGDGTDTSAETQSSNQESLFCLGNTCLDEDSLRELLRESNVNVIRPDTIENQNNNNDDQNTNNQDPDDSTLGTANDGTSMATSTDQGTNDTAASISSSTASTIDSVATTTDQTVNAATGAPTGVQNLGDSGQDNTTATSTESVNGQANNNNNTDNEESDEENDGGGSEIESTSSTTASS